MTASSGRARLVALRFPDTHRSVEAIRATWARGDAVLPIPHSWSAAVTRDVLARLRPHELVDPSGRRALEDPVAVEDDVAAVVTTSGTTGAPKGVVLTHAALRASAAASLDRLGVARDDRWLLCLPVHHVAGLLVLVRSELGGTEPVVHGGFDPVRVAAATEASAVSLVPTMLHRLLDAGAGLGHLRHVLLGGAAPPRDLIDRAAVAGVPVTVTYGATETSGGCVYDGVPLDGVAVRLGEGDRIEISGPVLMRGYRGDPDRTAEVLRDGWLRTADVGAWTEDGRLEVLGRTDDVVVTGGVKVAPAVVAEVLRAHPAVADAAVAGRDDPEWGQVVVARVVPVDAGRAPSLDDLRAWVAERLDAHAAPRDLVLVDRIDRTELGKVRRRSTRGRPQ